MIGLLVGLMMGITGSGGAIIAIPLFQLLLNSTLKEATILSLVTVVLGTVVNLPGHTRTIKWKIALGFAMAGTVANYLSLPLKEKIPEGLVATLLVVIGIFSIWSVWNAPDSGQSGEKKIHFITVSMIGLFLGLVTTLTGLGGGVLLIPILLRVFRMNYEEALPTSLSTILLISLSALFIQGEKVLALVNLMDLFLTAIGVLAAFAALRFVMRSLDDVQKLRVRKSVFSAAALASLIIVILKLF